MRCSIIYIYIIIYRGIYDAAGTHIETSHLTSSFSDLPGLTQTDTATATARHLSSGKLTKVGNGQIHYKWPFSIAFCIYVYQRVKSPKVFF